MNLTSEVVLLEVDCAQRWYLQHFERDQTCYAAVHQRRCVLHPIGKIGYHITERRT